MIRLSNAPAGASCLQLLVLLYYALLATTAHHTPFYTTIPDTCLLQSRSYSTTEEWL